MAKGWLEVNPRYLAALFNLRSTGNARMDMETGRILVEVDDPKILEEGQVVEGISTTYHGNTTIPTGWRPKGGTRAPV